MKILGRPSKYRKKLMNNPYWEQVKVIIKTRDKWICRICKKNFNLHVHHISYSISGADILGNELNYLEWLITLCQTCHKEVHKIDNHPLNPKNKHKLNSNQYEINTK